MSNVITQAAAGFKNLLTTYPALSAAIVNFGVFVAGYYGLKITANQLVMYSGVADVLFGLVVHSNVVPLAKLAKPPAGSAQGNAGEPAAPAAPKAAPASAASAETPTAPAAS